MAEYPAMTLWTDAYLADTRHLSTEEHGAYLLLLMAMWRSPDGWLQDDDARLARMAGLGLKKWRRIRPALDGMLTVRDGSVSQKRLLEERERAEAHRNQKRQAGRASAEARSQKPDSISDTQNEVFENYSGHSTANHNDAVAQGKALNTPECASTDVAAPLERTGQRRGNGGATTSSPSPSPSPSSHSAPHGAGAEAPSDDGGDAALFRRGRQILGHKSGGVVKQLRDHHGGSIPLARATIEQAAEKHSPMEYVQAVIKKKRNGEPQSVSEDFI